MWFPRLFCVVFGFLASGCASTQLNYNAADLASSLGSLMKSQIFYNLAQALGDPDFVPSQVTISIGGGAGKQSSGAAFVYSVR